MAKLLLILLLLSGLAAAFYWVADWFQQSRNINIVPPAIIEMVAVVLFCFNYGGDSAKEIMWVYISVAIVLIITIINIMVYGVKYGILASVAELAFSVSTVVLLLCVLLIDEPKRRRKNTRRRN